MLARSIPRRPSPVVSPADFFRSTLALARQRFPLSDSKRATVEGGYATTRRSRTERTDEHERASARQQHEPERGEARRDAARRGATRRDATRHGKCTVERARERESERARDRESARARERESEWQGRGREGGLRSGRGEGKRAFIIAVRFCHTPGARARNSALPGIANTNFGTRQRRPKFTNEISELAGKMWDRAARSISRKISGGQQERD